MLQRPYGRLYYPPTEIILDHGSHMTIVEFKEAIAGHLTLSADTIVVAKKGSGNHEWIVIEDKLEVSSRECLIS